MQVIRHLDVLEHRIKKDPSFSLSDKVATEQLTVIRKKAESDVQIVKQLQQQLQAQKQLTETVNEMLNVRNEQLALFKSILDKVASPYTTDEDAPLS